MHLRNVIIKDKTLQFLCLPLISLVYIVTLHSTVLLLSCFSIICLNVDANRADTIRCTPLCILLTFCFELKM